MHWGRQKYLEPARFDGAARGREHRGLWHGVSLISGPTGGGKTALAVMFVWNLAMKPEFQCKGRSCNNYKCTTKWTIYTNSTKLTGPGWLRKGEVVVFPIDEILPKLQAKQKVDHVIFFVDEVQEWIDNRESMSRDNKEVSYIIAQMRKLTCKTYMTTPNINTIDRRVRDMAKRTFNCWCPDGKATNVRALVRDLNVGHLAPWERDSMPDAYREYFTEPYKHLYDTHEQLSPPSFFNINEKVNVRFEDPTTGEPNIMTTTYRSALEDVVLKSLLLDYVMQPTAAQIIDMLFQHFGIQFDTGRLATAMKALGYTPQDNDTYNIGVIKQVDMV